MGEDDGDEKAEEHGLKYRIPRKLAGGMKGPLLTDLYQLTMAYGYWKHGLGEREACFQALIGESLELIQALRSGLTPHPTFEPEATK